MENYNSLHGGFHMSKISERRERTANTKIDPKAYLAEAPAQKKEYIYKILNQDK